MLQKSNLLNVRLLKLKKNSSSTLLFNILNIIFYDKQSYFVYSILNLMINTFCIFLL